VDAREFAGGVNLFRGVDQSIHQAAQIAASDAGQAASRGRFDLIGLGGIGSEFGGDFDFQIPIGEGLIELGESEFFRPGKTREDGEEEQRRDRGGLNPRQRSNLAAKDPNK